MRAIPFTSSALIFGLAVVSEASKIFRKIDTRSPNSHLKVKEMPPPTTTTSTPVFRTSIPEFAPTTECPLCELERHPVKRKLTEKQLDEFRLEIIRRQILSKLHLEREPNITVYKKFPRPLINEEMASDSPDDDSNKEEDHFYGRTKEIVAVGEIIPGCYSYRTSTCVRFDVSSTSHLSVDDIESAKLWIYKLNDKGDRDGNQTFSVSELAQHSHKHKKYRSRSRITHKSTAVRNGSVSFDIKNVVRRWILKPHKNFGIRISCKTCRRSIYENPISVENGLQPYVVIKMKNNAKRRQKRNHRDCSSGTDKCCRQHLSVNFEALNLKYFVNPESYNANYCKGSCDDYPIEQSPYSYTNVWNRAKSAYLDATVQQAMRSCCVPTRMSSLSIIYQKENGVFEKTDLPNMKVEECGCL